MASRRSSSAVVPAWLASPGTSIRQRPCGQMWLPTPVGVHIVQGTTPARRAGSTNAPIRPWVRIRPGASGSRPAAANASAIVVPSASVRARPVRVRRAPVRIREPAATPSGTLLVDEVDDGHRTVGSVARGTEDRTASNEGTTPSGPSKAPPEGTESRCEPVTTAGAAPAAPGSPHQAHWFPTRSVVRSSPGRSPHRRTTPRRSWSVRVQAKRS